MVMADESWGHLENIFQHALDLPVEQRELYLAEACAGDSELRKEVDALIAAHEAAKDFIESPVVVANPASFLTGATETDEHATAQLPTLIGRRIGAWQIVREVGRGGMGVVYLAQRADDAFQKLVAMKLIKRGMDTDFILRRFRNERQILANLDHPNIARLLDGGTTEDGLPYFVMEYIEGQPLNRYCDEWHLSIRERLRLFQHICGAVHYAHRNAVLHRDIKPGNILVTVNGTPKLLDFGIAKLLDPELDQETVDQTSTTALMMTPEYASPEQIRGEKLTPASDQYSLGVLLYELLTGRRPYRFPNRLPHEIARVICEETPARPSDAVGGNPESEIEPASESVGRNRNASLKALRNELSGDLDEIIMKALRKDPERRYESVEQFSADIGRFLEGHPAAAAADSLPTSEVKEYVTSETSIKTRSLAVLPFKLLHPPNQNKVEDRNRFLSIGLADALITRLSNLHSVAVRPTSSVLKFASDNSDALAAAQTMNVGYVLDGRILRSGEQIRVTVQLMKREDGAVLWASQFDEKDTDILVLQDSIATQVANWLVPQLTDEEQAQLAKRGTNNPQAYEAYLRGRYYGHTYTEDGLAKAIVSFYEAIALDPNYALAYSGVANYFNWLGHYGVMPPGECFAAAKNAALRAIELDHTLAEGYASLGFTVWGYDWDVMESERLLRHALELNPNYAQAHEWYGQLHSSLGRHEAAIRAMRRAQQLDPYSPSLAAMFAFCLHNARRYEEGLAQLTRALETDPDYIIALQGLGWVLPPLGRHEEAIASCRRAVELSGRTPLVLFTLGHILAVGGKEEEARRIVRELEEISTQRYIPLYQIAMIYTGLGEFDSAFAWLDKAIERRDYWCKWLRVEPRFDPLRQDPRFAEYLERIRPLPSSQSSTAALIQRNRATIDEPASADLPPASVAEAYSAAPDESAQSIKRLPLSIALFGVSLLLIVLATFIWLKWSFRFGAKTNSTNRVYPFRLTHNPGEDKYAKVSPDGRKIAFSSNRDGKSEIYVMRVDGSGKLQRLTINQVEDVAPAWSPDGKKLAFDRITVAGAESDIYMMDADGGNQINLTHTPGYDTRAAWSPDGKKIAFASNRGSAVPANFDIYVINVDGSNITRLTNDPGFEDDPAWSPDGARIAFTRATREGSFEIFVMNADGSNQINLTNNPAQDNNPAWSPDGKLIAFSSSRPFNNDYKHDIFVMNDSGGNVRRITSDPAHDVEPSWLPDNRHLIFFGNRDGNFELYETDIDSNLEISDGAGADAARKSIVVLPFTIEGGNELEDSLGSSIADALTRQLGQIKRISVRSVSASPLGTTKAQQIGRELNVDHILRGTLRQAGETMQVSAELLSANDGKILWAERFDEHLADISKLQNSLSEHVLSAMTVNLTASERQQLLKRYTDDSEAYQLYLAGRYHWSKRSVSGLKEAINYFHQALKKDATFALAYAGLADCYAMLKVYQVPAPPEAHAQAKVNAMRALALDDSLAEAHASLGYVKFYFDRDRNGAMIEFRRALELNPSYATAHHWLAQSLSAMGKHDEALSEIKLAQQLSPRSAIITTAAGMLFFYARQYDQAIAHCRKALEMDPGLVPAHRLMRWTYQAMGNYEEAFAAYQKERSFSGVGKDDAPGWMIILAQLYAIGRNRTEAQATLAQAISSPKAKHSGDFLTYEIALAYALLNERDQALSWLTKADAAKAFNINFVLVDPRLDQIRSDARFAGLMRKAGFNY